MTGRRYLLALNVPVFRAADGRLFADPSWAKDLLLQARHVPALTYFGPMLPKQPETGWIELPPEQVRIIGFAPGRGGLGGYLALLRAFPALVREVRDAKLVHTGIAGHPVPLGWLAVPLARVFRRPIVILVESAFWRIPPGVRAGLLRRLRARLHEAINRACLASADHAGYAQEGWRRSLPSPRAGGGVLFRTSWIDAETVVAADDLAQRWASREAGGTPIRLLFAGRMIPEKGTAVLSCAIQLLGARGVPLRIDVIGAGPERARFERMAAARTGSVHLQLLDPVPYGPTFFTLLDGYDALLVPSISDEQPRNVYDGYARGVPSIASDTAGLRMVVEDGATGRLVSPGSPEALADALAGLTRADLARWGMAGRAVALENTHERMHAERAAALARFL